MGFKIGTVRRQEVQPEASPLLSPPISVESSVMIASVIGDDDHAPPCPSTGPSQFLEKGPKAHGVKALGLPLVHELTVPQADPSKVADTLSRGVVQQHRILGFRWNPHAATGAILLKVHFVQSPQIDLRMQAQGSEFFLCA
jgi:hypothetical protein